ncbi:MAG: DUF1175 family protein [Acidobacteriota bacterium]
MRHVRVTLAALGFTLGALAAPVDPPPGPEPAADRTAFRRWFTFLTESRYYARKPVREVVDGDSLVRWAFRQALASHDYAWSRGLELPVFPLIPSVSAGFSEVCARDGGIPLLISRDVSDAQPGDLLRYRNTELPSHVMIYIGPSQVVPSHGAWVVYMASRTIHKVSVGSLLADPSPDWRPVSENPDFLGVWRLDILSSRQCPQKFSFAPN